MERYGDIIFFDKEERSVAGLPCFRDIADIESEYQRVARLRANCAASIQEVSLEDVYETEQLQHVRAIAQLTNRYNRLEAISRGLGGLVAETMEDGEVELAVDEWLAEVPGLALDRLHDK